MHLMWQMPAPTRSDPIVEVSAVIQIDQLPEVPRLFFWALQVSFVERAKTIGAGHLGLQFHPDYPVGGAVNWGGYHGSGSTGSGELPGSSLHIPSTLANPNTGDYPWQPGRRYRYRIYRSPERGWRGSVVDLESGIETVIRDLWCPGSNLGDCMVWTEAFADCDDPGVSVRWSDLEAITVGGSIIQPTAVRVNYQTVANGGCITTNTALSKAEPGTRPDVIQETGTTRTVKQGSILNLG